MTHDQAETMIALLTDIRDALTIGGDVEQKLSDMDGKLGDVVHKLTMMDLSLSALG